MKEFMRVPFDPAECRRELNEFGTLLGEVPELEENAHVKPFSEARHHLSAFLGSYAWNFSRFDLLAFQYQLFGDYSCDMVVGDSVKKSFGFVEWEDATEGALFRRQGRKATPEWAGRFERGFSQLVDWFHKIDDMARTDEFEVRFGAYTSATSASSSPGGNRTSPTRASGDGGTGVPKRWWSTPSQSSQSLTTSCICSSPRS